MEVKCWGGGAITMKGDVWYKGGRKMDHSHVSVTLNKLFLIKNKIKHLKERLIKYEYLPRIEVLVLMAGNADISKLPNNEKYHILNLSDFLLLANEESFSVTHAKQIKSNRGTPFFDHISMFNL
ncbi:MAG: hypothetical protein ACI81G_001153, partial [Gammaproteobacteria bacterium]